MRKVLGLIPGETFFSPPFSFSSFFPPFLSPLPFSPPLHARSATSMLQHFPSVVSIIISTASYSDVKAIILLLKCYFPTQHIQLFISRKRRAYTCQPKIFLCRTKSHILQDLSCFCRTPPVFFKHTSKNHWSYTSDTLILYQNARNKFRMTLSRICKTAGYLRQQSYKSRTVGNYRLQ